MIGHSLNRARPATLPAVQPPWLKRIRVPSPSASNRTSIRLGWSGSCARVKSIPKWPGSQAVTVPQRYADPSASSIVQAPPTPGSITTSR